jgi:two-component sensor histidine kinase
MSDPEEADLKPITPAELRHRLANLFQLLSTLTRMRIQRSADPETRRQLAWMLEQISALGLLQQRLIDPLGGDFAEYLNDMMPHWRRRCAGRPVQLDVLAAPLVMREQLASALAVIANELVSNAIAHAHPDGRAGSVRIELNALPDGRGVLTVSDDGVGYVAAAADRSKLGLWLVRGLTEQVRGVLTTTNDGGVTATLEFPMGSAP